MNIKITFKRLLMFIIFNTGMRLVLTSLNHAEPLSYLFGMIAGCFWVLLITD